MASQASQCGGRVVEWASLAPRPGRYHPDTWPMWLQMALTGALGALIALLGVG
jgi:hypothetical protein